MEKKEIFDIVDVNGNVIGSRTRAECHSNSSLIHPTVHFTLFNRDNNTVLMTVRGLEKTHDPGKHVFMGEHMVSGESFEDGLIRGVNEELGFIPKEYLYVGTHIFKYDEQTEYSKMYLVFSSGTGIHADKREIEEYFWLDAKNIKNYDENIGEITRYWIANVDWMNI